MKASVDRLRWVLAGTVIVLLGGLVVLGSYGRWTAARKWKQLLSHSGAHLSHESDNVTYSQTVQGRTVFTIRAKKAVPFGDGKWTLHGVTMLLYGKTADRIDRVDGAEFEYDEKSGVARAIGEVHIDVQAPGALAPRKQRGVSGPAEDEAAAALPTESRLDNDRGVIHVKTSGLVYVRKLGVAATDQRVEFRYAGMNCVSQGAEFDTADSALHLLARVRMDGTLHGQPATVLASRADLDRDENTITVVQPVATSRGQTAKAAGAILQLRPDGSLERVDGSGGVMLDSGVERVRADQLEATFNADNLPLQGRLTGNVVLDGSASKPMHGTATAVDLAYGHSGALTGVRASGPVQLTTRVTLAGGASAARELRGQLVTADFLPVGRENKSVLRSVHAVGSASVGGESPVSGVAGVTGTRSTRVAADDLLAQFASAAVAQPHASTELRQLTAAGHISLEQHAPGGLEQSSRADRLEASFLPGGGFQPGVPPHGSSTGISQGNRETDGLRIQVATESGHVQIRSRRASQGREPAVVSTGSGDTAVFSGAEDRLTLTGHAGFAQGNVSLAARSIAVEQGSGNADAESEVAATLAAARSGPGDAQADSGSGSATHVLASRAHLVHASQTAEFFGSDAEPARLWQAGSQVLAADLFLDEAHHSLTARPAAGGGVVEAVFVRSPTPGEMPAGAVQEVAAKNEIGAAPGHSTTGAVHVTTPALRYSDLTHEAVCSGGVRVRSGDADVRAMQAVLWLSDNTRPGKLTGVRASAEEGRAVAGLGGSLDRIVFSGDVKLHEPNRAGEGEHLLYTAATGSYVLTGTAAKLPRVADAELGTVTGTTLLLRSGDNTVIVNGETVAAAAQARGARVHTEVNMRRRP